MGLKIIWLEKSVLDLREIFDYYKIKACVSISRKIVNSIRESVNILKTQTNVVLSRNESVKYSDK